MIGECADCGLHAELHWIPDPAPGRESPDQPTVCGECKARRERLLADVARDTEGER